MIYGNYEIARRIEYAMLFNGTHGADLMVEIIENSHKVTNEKIADFVTLFIGALSVFKRHCNNYDMNKIRKAIIKQPRSQVMFIIADELGHHVTNRVITPTECTKTLLYQPHYGCKTCNVNMCLFCYLNHHRSHKTIRNNKPCKFECKCDCSAVKSTQKTITWFFNNEKGNEENRE